MFSFWQEKLLIAASFLAAIPLFFLDKQLFGPRRYAWPVTMCTGLVSLVFVDPADKFHGFLDKITVAALCVTLVPHFLQLVKYSPLVGFATILPIFVVVGITTLINSEAYWKQRAFLHVVAFVVPYLNHLPSGDESKRNDGVKEEVMKKTETSATEAPLAKNTKSSSKKSHINKTTKPKSGDKKKKSKS